ncbi:MAG: hypothetical protein K8R88_06975 [Armatimonadetes bacterium]|nr:hypothetical protein [Armatimonadota bacterium]
MDREPLSVASRAEVALSGFCGIANRYPAHSVVCEGIQSAPGITISTSTFVLCAMYHAYQGNLDIDFVAVGSTLLSFSRVLQGVEPASALQELNLLVTALLSGPSGL